MVNDSTLRRAWASARERWTPVEVSWADFDAYVHARTAGARTEREIAYEDLYLACACVRGDDAALKHFDRAHLSAVDRAIQKAASPAFSSDDLRQIVRERLFVGASGPGKIAEYSGKGPLVRWVRIAATRIVLNVVTRTRREIPVPDTLVHALIGAAENPEVHYFRAIYREEFRVAFAHAYEELNPRDRRLLRCAFQGGLNVDRIGKIFGVHRATAARWVAAAHERLLAKVRSKIKTRLGLTDREFESLLYWIRSQLEVSLRLTGAIV